MRLAPITSVGLTPSRSCNRNLAPPQRAERAAEAAILECYSSIMSILPPFAARTCALILAILFGTVSIEATTAYAFVVESSGSYTARRSGRLISDGNRWRLDYDDSSEVRAHDAVIGGSADRRIAVNHSNKTWYYLEPTAPTIYLPTVFDFYRGNPSKASKFRFDASQTGRQEISFQYDTLSQVGTESLRGEVSVRITHAASDFHVENGIVQLLYVPRTGIAEIDVKLRDALTRVEGNVGSSEITITRRFRGGAPMTQVIRVRILEAKESTLKPDDFKIPDGYEYQPPVIGIPGGQSIH